MLVEPNRRTLLQGPNGCPTWQQVHIELVVVLAVAVAALSVLAGGAVITIFQELLGPLSRRRDKRYRSEA